MNTPIPDPLQPTGPPRPPARPAAPSWAAAVGLGLLALLRPVARLSGAVDALGTPAGPLLLTGAVTAVWVLVVGLSRLPRPVLTLTLAGVVYAVATIPLSAVLSTVLDGSLAGPLATPVAIVPLLLVNAAWGALAGVLALAVRHLRGRAG